MSDPRRDRLRARVAALSDAGRRALVDTLGRERGADEVARLVAFLVLDDASGDRSPEAPTDERLRAFLAERLPPYMVPSRFALLPRLPRTAAGKLDRRVLEREEGAELPAAARSVVAPRTPAEATLAAIWTDVLRLDDVSVHDDFFEIGGDSLLSIRVIARAGREGLRIPVDRFFDGPTIARLAAVVEESARPAPATNGATPGGQGIVTGEAPPTPIQRWFFDAISEHREHWNQSHLLEVRPSVPGDAIETAVRALIAHHDALRLRLVERDGEWRQHFSPMPERTPFRVADLSAHDPADYVGRVAEQCAQEHASLRLDEGPLFRAVLFEGAGGWRRLLLLAHHLVVDGVSWDVLFEDLAALLGPAERGEPTLLPAKTSSARDWALGLVREAARPAVAASARHWLTLGDPTPVRVDATGAARGNLAGDAVVRTVSLDDGAGRLGDAARRLDAPPQALLLAALLLAWRRWSGRDDLLLDVEGHGRDALGDGLDVSRTVGWFTTVFPVRLIAPAASAGGEPSTAAVVRAVDDTLRAVPGRGASHGLLRWLSPDASLRAALAARPRPGLLFNYLGVRREPFAPEAPVRIAMEPHGRARSPEGRRAYPVEINARVEGERVVLDVEYSRRLHDPRSIERFADALLHALRAVVDARPGVFALAAVDDEALSRVAALLAEVDDA